jgi:hypothetical protein
MMVHLCNRLVHQSEALLNIHGNWGSAVNIENSRDYYGQVLLN